MTADDNMALGASGGGPSDDEEMALGASGGRPPAPPDTIGCATVGCHARLPRLTRAGTYCADCRRVVEATYYGGEVLAVMLRDLRALETEMVFIEPYPHALPCIACSSPRPALPWCLWCSPKCQRWIWTFVQRGFQLVNIGGVVLPARTWRALRGLRPSTFRMRRVQFGVVAALVMPLDTGRSRSALASVAVRRGHPALEDIEVRDIARSMTPRIITLK